MKTYTIQPAEKIVIDEEEKETIVKIDVNDRLIEIKGDIREEFSINDLLTQIGLIEGQIKNIKKAKEDKPEEIASLFDEMLKYKNKIDEVNKEFSLKVELPILKTEKELEVELDEELVEKEIVEEIDSKLSIK